MGVTILGAARQLARGGVEVEVLTRAVGEPGEVEVEPGLRVIALAAGPRAVVPAERLSEVTDEFGEAVAQRAGRGGPGYDLIHAHHWSSGIATLPVALELGIPFVQSFHSLGGMRNRARPRGHSPEPELRTRSETFLSTQADAVVAASAAEVASLIDLVGAPAGKLWVVPPGVDADVFTPGRSIAEGVVRRKLGIDAGRPILVVAGRLDPVKGQDLAVAAVAAMAHDRPVLVIAGDAAPGAERWARGLRDLIDPEFVRFTGVLEREDLADVLATAQLTLVPSLSETFGLIALESAASGTPVLAAAALARTGAVDANASGVLLGSRDPSEWARAIEALLDDRMLLGELSASARDFATGFSWAATAAALRGIYAGVLAR